MSLPVIPVSFDAILQIVVEGGDLWILSTMVLATGALHNRYLGVFGGVLPRVPVKGPLSSVSPVSSSVAPALQ